LQVPEKHSAQENIQSYKTRYRLGAEMEIMISSICSTDREDGKRIQNFEEPCAKQRRWIEEKWEVDASNLLMYTMADFGVQEKETNDTRPRDVTLIHTQMFKHDIPHGTKLCFTSIQICSL
jgi:hypothetical protein